jgi:hypothetical protein
MTELGGDEEAVDFQPGVGLEQVDGEPVVDGEPAP